MAWGGVGTDAQHAVFQLLHQGTHLVPVEFVAAIEAEHGLAEEHHAQIAHQLLRARRGADGGPRVGRSAPRLSGRPAARRRSCSTGSIRATLGALLAFYEHRTFANAALLGINPFDQFGVELGKDMARALDGEGEELEFDPSTRALLARAFGDDEA